MRITAGTTPSVDETDRIARLLGVTRSYAERSLLGTKSFSFGRTLAPGVGNNQRIQLQNPLASGVTAVVLSLVAQTLVADTLVLKNDVALMAFGSAGRNNLAGGANSVCGFTSDVIVGVPATPMLWQLAMLANTPYQVPSGADLGIYVLPSNTALTLWATTPNQTIGMAVRWIEVDPTTLL